MASSSSRNILLATIIAFSVYVPFEIVAKVSLGVATFLFVLDPIPPYSRLIAIVSCAVVLKLNSWHRDTIIAEQHYHEQQAMEIIDSDNNTSNTTQDKESDDKEDDNKEDDDDDDDFVIVVGEQQKKEQ